MVKGWSTSGETNLIRFPLKQRFLGAWQLVLWLLNRGTLAWYLFLAFIFLKILREDEAFTGNR